jgi:hypothetical protein
MKGFFLKKKKFYRIQTKIISLTLKKAFKKKNLIDLVLNYVFYLLTKKKKFFPQPISGF